VNLLEKTRLLGHALRWRLTWDRRDTAYRPAEVLPAKFVSARAAVDHVGDATCVISSGFAGNARCSILFWALRERFEDTGRPRGLTWVSVAAQGGRGRVPGTVEEVGLDGLVTCYVSGHTETAKSMLRLADAGKLELHTLPQGEMAHVIEAQGRRDKEVCCRTGIGTFLDPRVGRGSPVTAGATRQLIRVDGENLVYTLPAIDVAFINAPYADRDGNVYFSKAATISENADAARAARKNGGLVIVAVSGLVDRDDTSIALPAECVDAIVVNPYNEQAGSVPQQKYWEMFTAGASVDALKANEQLRFLNQTLGITPRRSRVDHALARLGAKTFVGNVARGATVNVGVGLAEEICLELFKSEARDGITFTTESGPYGGLPASGIFFGAAINPLRLESSAWMFHHYTATLDAALLGFLELDSTGSINLSKRGPRMLDYVGPGGAPSIIEAAKTVLFAGHWMQGARISVNGDRLRVVKPGAPKLVEQVSEVTFNGQVALADNKRIFYVTDLALLELTAAGLTLRAVMPGIDIGRDLLANADARIHVPDDPAPETVPAAVVTGRGFQLNWTGAAT
jgi:propionate CoA-transferase